MLGLNLLPPVEKRNLAIIWRTRVVMLISGGVVAVVAIGVLLLLPTYFFIGLQTAETVRAAELERQSQAQSGIEAEITRIRAANRLAEIVEQYQAGRRPVFGLFETVIRKAGGVRIENLEFKGKERQFVLRGFAPTRQDLLAFVAALEADEAIAEVSSPVANLIREVAISFSLTITLN
ncbi:hypothetical protein C4552_00795 [Candidatus Parcubacteria bacterium]|nr:MAG: hypothetical protein C4552_00795 [Candidatus Parcubacteria bacterium]